MVLMINYIQMKYQIYLFIHVYNFLNIFGTRGSALENPVQNSNSRLPQNLVAS